ncbi:MAG: hypothetical protein JRS35_09400, partial [Deltaproteobacteria bacterium]|nr:hypothetical protein [Deltaproteobacteria bacterium]
MSHASKLAERHASELRGIADTLPGLFARAAGALEERLGTSALSRWAEIAIGLADRAPQAAIAFIETTPAALAHLEIEELEVWADQGRRLCRGSWKSAKLAARFFRMGPGLLEALSLQVLERLVDVVARLAQRSEELAAACLQDSPSRLARLAENDREPFLTFTLALCSTSWTDAHRCFERGPDLLESVRPEQREGLLDLAAAAARQAGPDGFSLFAAAAEALGTLDPKEQAEVVGCARRFPPHGARAAIESLASAPEVRRRLTPPRARRWTEAGLELLTEGQAAERAESYFRIESALAEEMLAELAPRAELSNIGAVLRLYAKALSGEPILLQPTTALVGRKIGWAAGATTTDGISIFLPTEIGVFGDQDANFQVYKVYTTHQAARLEFGSFRYCFGVDGEHLASTVQDRERQRPKAPSSPAVIPMQRFFDLFDDRRLVSELFALVEDARIDACVSREYAGIRRWLRRVQELEFERRPDVRRMALRQAFVENLLRASLGRPDTIRWPRGLAARLERAVATLRLVERPGATVQDTAEVAAALYDLSSVIPNLPAERLSADWSELDEQAASQAPGPGGAGLHADEELPEGDEVPYESPDPLEYRGEFKPELVQLLAKLADQEGTEQSGAPLTREEILELLENSAEIEFSEDADEQPGDLDALLTNIEREAADRVNGDAEHNGTDDEGALWFHYDEWDFRANDYRPDWCRLGESTTPEGELDFYDETLQRYHGLVVETRRQFERMR